MRLHFGALLCAVTGADVHAATCLPAWCSPSRCPPSEARKRQRRLDGLHRTGRAGRTRPHWGQENKLTAGQVARLYGNNLVRWREALLATTGTSTLFSNDFTRQRGLRTRTVSSARSLARARTPTATSRTSAAPPTPAGAPSRSLRPSSRSEVARAVYNFSSVDGSNAFVHVIDDPDGPYLRTDPDATAANNLDQSTRLLTKPRGTRGRPRRRRARTPAATLADVLVDNLGRARRRSACSARSSLNRPRSSPISASTIAPLMLALSISSGSGPYFVTVTGPIRDVDDTYVAGSASLTDVVGVVP